MLKTINCSASKWMNFLLYADFEEIKENMKPAEGGVHGLTEDSEGMRRTNLDPLVHVKVESDTQEASTTLFYKLLHEINPNNVDNTEVSGSA